MKILMVCLGNICRSPLAEGIMRQKIKERKLSWDVGSAGTGAYHVGELPDPRSIEVARINNIDITNQSARQFHKDDLFEFDAILVMDAMNYQDVMSMATTAEQEEKVELIMNYASPGRNEQVPDPYYGERGFDHVFEMLDEACEAVIERFLKGQ